MSATSLPVYHRLIASSRQVEGLCRLDGNMPIGKRISISPTVGVSLSRQDSTLPENLWSNTAVANHKVRLQALLDDHVEKAKSDVEVLYQDALAQTVSIEGEIGLSDLFVQQAIQKGFQHIYRSVADRLREAVIERIQSVSEQSKKASGFCSETTYILEAAFNRSQNLSQRECSIVAQASGITHQQVRTWFQNRRNRKTKGRRTASTSALPTQPADQEIPATRRVISLPKRATKTASTTNPTSAAAANNGRVIRSLPKRGGQAAQANAVSPTSSLSSMSTVGSIPPAGGFTSPMNQNNGCQPTISFGGSTVPYIQTTPTQYAEYNQNQSHSGPSLNLVPPTPGHDWYTQGNFGQSPVEMTPSSEFPSFQLAMGTGNAARVDESAIDPTLAHTPSWSSPTNSDWSNFSFPSHGSEPTPEQYSKFRLDEMVAKSEEEMLFQLKEWLDTSFEVDATPASMDMGGELDVDFTSDILDGIMEQNTDVGMFEFDNAMELAAMEGEPRPVPVSISGRSTPSLVNSASTGDLSTQASTESFSYQSVGYPSIAVYSTSVAAASGSIIDPSLQGESAQIDQSAQSHLVPTQLPSQAVAQAVESSGWAQGALPFDDFGYKVDQGVAQGTAWSEGESLVNGWDQRTIATA